MRWYLFASDIRPDTDLNKMKFLVLALCVCAASAASYSPFSGVQSNQQRYNPYNTPFAAAKATVNAVEPAAKAAYETAVPVAYEAAKVVATPFIAAGNAIKNAYDEAVATVVNQDTEVRPDGYRYRYQTSNGIAAEASGSEKVLGDSVSQVVQGYYEYSTPEGRVIRVNYVADENGFQPESDAIPVAPAVPEAIVRSLEYLRNHPNVENKY